MSQPTVQPHLQGRDLPCVSADPLGDRCREALDRFNRRLERESLELAARLRLLRSVMEREQGEATDASGLRAGCRDLRCNIDTFFREVLVGQSSACLDEIVDAYREVLQQCPDESLCADCAGIGCPPAARFGAMIDILNRIN